MEIWENEADTRILFTELSYMVASCIMLDSARQKIRGMPSINMKADCVKSF